MNYFSMNEVSVGTEVKIKNSDLKGRVVEVFHFPTTFKVEFELVLSQFSLLFKSIPKYVP